MIVRLVRVLRLAMPLGVMAVVVMAGVSRPDVLSQAGPEAATMERLRTLTGNDCFVKSTTTLSAPLNDLVAAGTVPAIEGGIPAVREGDLGRRLRHGTASSWAYATPTPGS